MEKYDDKGDKKEEDPVKRLERIRDQLEGTAYLSPADIRKIADLNTKRYE